jgi:hypothetical protein
MSAAHEVPLPDVRSFVMKSVSDFADVTKPMDFKLTRPTQVHLL